MPDRAVNDSKAIQSTQKAQTRFMLVELSTGMTFALLSQKGGEEFVRYRANARAAYDSVLRFIHRANLTPQESEAVQAGLRKLKAELEKIGESF